VSSDSIGRKADSHKCDHSGKSGGQFAIKVLKINSLI
jgi:hypothetical protein